MLSDQDLDKLNEGKEVETGEFIYRYHGGIIVMLVLNFVICMLLSIGLVYESNVGLAFLAFLPVFVMGMCVTGLISTSKKYPVRIKAVINGKCDGGVLGVDVVRVPVSFVYWD